MLLRRLYDTQLAQASYLIGCQRTGETLVVDPNRDIDRYLEAAEAEEVRITHVTETHIHADFVSGSRELAVRTGARLLLSREGGPDWTYRYAADAGAALLTDGDAFHVGNVRLDVLHTPGHTPEHLSFLVTDTTATNQPIGLLTGDFVFVADVGRPDLLERAAGVRGTMEASARELFRSLQRFRELPDYLQVWPGHGAGSACGRALGAVPSSTVGYEKIANWALATTDEEEFVALVLEGQPEPPKYFAQMKRINRDGPPVLGGFTRPRQLTAAELPAVLDSGAFVVDTRPGEEFAEGHLPGTVSVPLDGSFTTWMGWLVPYDAAVYLIVDEGARHGIEQAVRDLAMIGLDRVAGYFASEVVAAWAAERPVEVTRQTTAPELSGLLAEGRVTLLDVRSRVEWDAGHVRGALHVPLGYLPDRLADLPGDRPLVLQCQSGNRSAIGASILQARGRQDVANLADGLLGWRRAGLPVERPQVARLPTV